LEKASNNQIKQLRKLKQRKYRDKMERFLVEGERGIEQILANKLLEIEDVFVEVGAHEQFESAYPNALLLDKEVFLEISDTETPQGIIALCHAPAQVEMEELINETGIIVALDRIQDPGNMGTIIRTSSWFGAKAILVGKGSVDLYNPKVVRSTVGATGVLPTLSGDLNPMLEILEQEGWQVVLLDGNPGAVNIDTFEKPSKTILVVGNEANGIHPDLITQNRTRVMIPFEGNSAYVESLNAALAVGVALYALR